jgi:hypothetical protein
MPADSKPEHIALITLMLADAPRDRPTAHAVAALLERPEFWLTGTDPQQYLRYLENEEPPAFVQMESDYADYLGTICYAMQIHD